MLFTCLFAVPGFAGQAVKGEEKEYVILVSRAVQDDATWNPVVETLRTLHDALVIRFLHHGHVPGMSLFQGLQRLPRQLVKPDHQRVMQRP